MKRIGHLVMALAALFGPSGCNVQHVDPDSIADDSWRHILDPLPVVPAQDDITDPTTVWAAAVRRNLTFLTDPALGGRHPGTEGAQLTAGAVVSLFDEANLIPSAPTLGWTTRVGIRAIRVSEPHLSVAIPVTGEGGAATPDPERIEIVDGLWLRHRGAAGVFTLPMEVVALAPQTDLAGRLAVGIIPFLGDDLVDPQTRLRGIFDTLGSRRPGGCVLQLPPERTPELRDAALAWGDVDVQALPLGSDPPDGLPVEGFVSPETFSVLRRATGESGSTVDVSFEAVERWFEDANVVGRVAGHDAPEKVVLVTTNWDAGGLAPPNENGGEAQAASGLAVMLAIIERLSLLRSSGRIPARSVIFVAAAGGSLGNLGLEQIAAKGLALPENIVAVIHLERLDWTAPTLTVVGGTRSTVGERVQALLPQAELTDHESGYGHLVFNLPRVPRVTLTRRGGTEPELLEPSVPITALATSARIAFDLVWDLADAPDVPELIVPRVEPDTPEPDVQPSP